MKNKYRTLL